VGELKARAVRSAHSFPSSFGKFAELSAPPEPPLSKLSIPNGGTLAYLLELKADARVRFYFHDSFGDLETDDGSGEDYVANLNNALRGTSGVHTWLAAVALGTEAEAGESSISYARRRSFRTTSTIRKAIARSACRRPTELPLGFMLQRNSVASPSQHRGSSSRRSC